MSKPNRSVLARMAEQVIIQLKTVSEDPYAKIPDDPVEFCIKFLGFTPTEYQVKLLRDETQFIAARWARQTGKTHTVAAKLLHFYLKHSDCWGGVIGPSFRQTKNVIAKIAAHASKLPRGYVKKPMRTMITFTNGAKVEAFPNNPDTIRGPTLNIVYWDEMNFTRDDEELYDAILFTLGTTNGKFICTSTPWSKDSIFWKIFNDKDYADFARHHVRWEEAVAPKGPLNPAILEKIRKQLAADPWRWRREMEAEWAEDEDSYFPQGLITACIDPNLDYLEERWLVATA